MACKSCGCEIDDQEVVCEWCELAFYESEDFALWWELRDHAAATKDEDLLDAIMPPDANVPTLLMELKRAFYDELLREVRREEWEAIHG